MIHLVFGAAATSSLKHALRRLNHQIIGFPIDFSVGPITNIHKNSGIENYFNWLKSSYHPRWGYFEEDQTAYQQALQQLLEIKNGEHVTIWTCENASEQIGLRICCHLLKDKEVELTFINTFKAMKDYTKPKDITIDIRHTGECNSKQLAHFYNNSRCLIAEEMRGELEHDGEKFTRNTSIVRSWRHGELSNELETRDDSFILECAKRIRNEMRNLEFIKVIRVIGEVLGHTEQSLSDSWIEYRIRSLINAGQLKYEGDLQSMRYKIKVV